MVSKPAAATSVATPLAAPAVLDRGGRDLGAQTSPSSILDRGGRAFVVRSGPVSVPYHGGAPGAFHPVLAGSSAADAAYAAQAHPQSAAPKPDRIPGARAQ
jgi:hypothetical protein